MVAAAIIQDGRVLAAQRRSPPELAGRWEFPGGKVQPGETPQRALRRECREELAVLVAVADRLSDDVELGGGRRLRLYRCTTTDRPEVLEHRALRWCTADELAALPWLDSNRPLLASVIQLLPDLR